MSVFVRKGSKRGIYSYSFDFDGQPYFGSCKTTNLQKALQIERKIRDQVENSRWDVEDIQQLKNKKNALVKFELNAWYNRQTWDKSGASMHKTSLPKIMAFFGDFMVNQIKIETIEEYRAHRRTQVSALTKRTPSNATINREVSLIRQFLISKNRWYQIKEGKFKELKENKGVGRPIAETDNMRLLMAAQNLTSRVMYPVLMLSLLTGIRNRELRHLTWNDVRDGALWVKRKRAGASGELYRVVRISTLAQSLIENWRKNFPDAQPQHFVFCHHKYINGQLIRYEPSKPYATFAGSWRELRETVGVQCRWHDLRHTCASIQGKTASRATLKATFGWMSESELDRYCHSEQDQQQAGADMVDAHFVALLNQQSTEGGLVQ